MRGNDTRFINKLANPKFLFAFSLIILITSWFVANFVLQFFQSVWLWIEEFAKKPENASFSINWGSFFIFQKEYSYYYVGFFAVVLYGLVKFLYDMKVNYSSLNKGQYGTSEFERLKELKKQYKIIPGKDLEYEGDSGVIISALQEKGKPYRLLIDDGPVHTLCIGITRSGKGETFVVPMIDVISRAKNKSSLIVNDPKGELAAASYTTLKKRGYDVYVFNLIQQDMSMGFNPLQLVIDSYKQNNASLAQQYANSVAYSLYHDPNAKDPFWANSAKSLVTAIILAIAHDSIKKGNEAKINMYSIANFLSTMGSQNDDEGNNALDLFFQARDDNDPARMMYATSNFASGNTRSGIFSVAMEKLQIFTLEPNAKLTSYNSLNLSDVGFGEKPVAIFMVTPDYDASNHVLASIFISQLYRVNAEKATMSENGKMLRHVHFLLDEFGNMPTIEGMAGMVTVGAGRGFRFHLIIQSYSQIKSAYGEDSDTIIGNCSNQIYILTKDKGTAEQYSALLGSKTITDLSRSGKHLSTDKNESESAKERPLLMPDELMRLKEGESVVVRANKRQDKKGRKIAPIPIFNTGITSAKFRWQYLATDFDTSKSVQSLPINSKVYSNIKLQDIVFLTKTKQDLYIPLGSYLSKKEFHILHEQLRKLFLTNDQIIPDLDVMEKWSMLQLLSYLTYEVTLDYSVIEKKILRLVQPYILPSQFDEWKERILDVQSQKQEAIYVETEEDEWRNRALNHVEEF